MCVNACQVHEGHEDVTRKCTFPVLKRDQAPTGSESRIRVGNVVARAKNAFGKMMEKIPEGTEEYLQAKSICEYLKADQIWA